MGGIVSSIFGGGGSSAPTYTAPQGYIPQGSGAADQAWQAALASLPGANPYPALIPSYNTYANQNINNPYASAAQTAANTAGATAGNVGNELAGLSGVYSGEANNLTPFMSQILNMGMDPQSALYSQTLQKVNDQANVANAQYGLTGQAAAGNLQQADTNFNVDWQSQALARALQGISGAQNLASTQTGLGSAAGTAGTGAAQLQGQAGALPYSTYGQNIGNILQTLTGQGSFGAQNPAQIESMMQLIIPYLNQGTGATSVAGTNAGINANVANLAGQGLGSLFSGLSGIGNIFGGGGGGVPASTLSSYGVTPGAQDYATMFAADSSAAVPAAASSGGFWSGLGDLASSAFAFL